MAADTSGKEQRGISQAGEKREYIFREMPAAKALWTFAMPSIMSQLVILFYNMADTYFLGRVGNPYMVAAVSLVLPLYCLCIAFANLFGTGGGTLIARLLGMRRPDEAKKVSSFAAFLSVFAGLAYSLIFFVFQRPFLHFLGASGETIGYTLQYGFWVLVIGAAPSMLGLTLCILARNAGLSKEAGLVASGGALLNIALDPLFMFVLLPPGMEVTGAAVATLISNLFSLMCYIAIFRANRDSCVLRLLPTEGFPLRESVASLFSVGIPAALTTFLYELTLILIDKLAASYGDIQLAAIGIVMKIERLPTNICLGLCFGMVPLVGYNYAAKKYGRMKKIHRTTLLHGFAIALACLAVYELFTPQIMGMFISDAATAALGTSYLRVRSLCPMTMFACFNFCLFFQGVGMGRHALALAVLRQLVFSVPTLFLLNCLAGMTGVVWSQCTSDFCTALLSVLIFRRAGKNSWDRPEDGQCA